MICFIIVCSNREIISWKNSQTNDYSEKRTEFKRRVNTSFPVRRLIFANVARATDSTKRGTGDTKTRAWGPRTWRLNDPRGKRRELNISIETAAHKLRRGACAHGPRKEQEAVPTRRHTIRQSIIDTWRETRGLRLRGIVIRRTEMVARFSWYCTELDRMHEYAFKKRTCTSSRTLLCISLESEEILEVSQWRIYREPKKKQE